MGRHLRDPLLLAWLALCAATAVALVISSSGGAALLAIAIAKAALVIYVFMDLARAPLALRLVAAIWLVGVLGALSAIHAGWLG